LFWKVVCPHLTNLEALGVPQGFTVNFIDPACFVFLNGLEAPRAGVSTALVNVLKFIGRLTEQLAHDFIQLFNRM
jgi:hypothetical protein